MRKPVLILGTLAASLISFSVTAQDAKGPSDTHPQYQGIEDKQAYKELRKELHKKKGGFNKKDGDAMYKQMHRHNPKSLDKFQDLRDYRKKKHSRKGKPDYSQMSKEERKDFRAAWHKKKMVHDKRRAAADKQTKGNSFSYPELESYFQGIKEAESKMPRKHFKETRDERHKRFRKMTPEERQEVRAKWKEVKEAPKSKKD